MKALVIALVLFPTVAFAQQQTEYTVKITSEELNLISDGLQTQPFGKVVVLINKLRAQIMEQTKPPAPPVVETPKDEPK